MLLKFNEKMLIIFKILYEKWSYNIMQMEIE